MRARRQNSNWGRTTVPHREQRSLSRRRLLQLTGATTLGALAGCAGQFPGTDDGEGREVTPRSTVTAEPDTSVSLAAASGTIRPSPETSTTNWTYNEQFPGPELRVQEGDVLSVELTNDLQEETTIHWHGVPVPNPVDGVPNVTQNPIASGDTFTYTFRAEPAGTYFYHSHVGLQLDRGLLGPLIIEESDPHVEYDRDIVVFLNDQTLPGPTAVRVLAQVSLTAALLLPPLQIAGTVHREVAAGQRPAFDVLAPAGDAQHVVGLREHPQERLQHLFAAPHAGEPVVNQGHLVGRCRPAEASGRCFFVRH